MTDPIPPRILAALDQRWAEMGEEGMQDRLWLIAAHPLLASGDEISYLAAIVALEAQAKRQEVGDEA